MAISSTWLEDRAEEFKASVLFSTRLPLARATPITGSAIARAAWALPVTGLLVGLIGAVVFALAHRLGIYAWPSAALAVAATLLVTGCLHEDGLADTADGFGGGKTREQKLDIMRDSRIGTYGVCALVLALLLRASVVASLGDPPHVLWALIAAHGAARAAMIGFMFLVPAARGDGLSHDAGRPPDASVIGAGVLGILILACCLGIGLGIVALIVLVIVIALMAWLSLAQIDGQTGDVLGAVEQVSEIAILLVALG